MVKDQNVVERSNIKANNSKSRSNKPNNPSARNKRYNNKSSESNVNSEKDKSDISSTDIRDDKIITKTKRKSDNKSSESNVNSEKDRPDISSIDIKDDKIATKRKADNKSNNDSVCKNKSRKVNKEDSSSEKVRTNNKDNTEKISNPRSSKSNMVDDSSKVESKHNKPRNTKNKRNQTNSTSSVNKRSKVKKDVLELEQVIDEDTYYASDYDNSPNDNSLTDLDIDEDVEDLFVDESVDKYFNGEKNNQSKTNKKSVSETSKKNFNDEDLQEDSTDDELIDEDTSLFDKDEVDSSDEDIRLENEEEYTDEYSEEEEYTDEYTAEEDYTDSLADSEDEEEYSDYSENEEYVDTSEDEEEYLDYSENEEYVDTSEDEEEYSDDSDEDDYSFKDSDNEDDYSFDESEEDEYKEDSEEEDDYSYEDSDEVDYKEDYNEDSDEDEYTEDSEEEDDYSIEESEEEEYSDDYEEEDDYSIEESEEEEYSDDSDKEDDYLIDDLENEDDYLNEDSEEKEEYLDDSDSEDDYSIIDSDESEQSKKKSTKSNKPVQKISSKVKRNSDDIDDNEDLGPIPFKRGNSRAPRNIDRPVLSKKEQVKKEKELRKEREKREKEEKINKSKEKKEIKKSNNKAVKNNTKLVARTKDTNKKVSKPKKKSSGGKKGLGVNKIVIAVVVVVVLIVMFLVKGNSSSDKETVLSLTDTLLSQQVGSFRYVIDVRTNEHKTGSNDNSSTDSSIEDLENMESAEDGEESASIESSDENVEDSSTEDNADLPEEDSSTEDNADLSDIDESDEGEEKFSEWSKKDNVEITDWEYPNYKLTFEGCVKSNDPLEMNATISLATNYFNDKLTDIIVKDNKTYINIEQLRYWLLNSHDGNLVNLGSSLPESAKYVEYNENEFSIFSNYAEDSELDDSRESNPLTLYNRFLVAEKTIVPKLNIPSNCIAKNDGVYSLNISGDNSVAFLNSFKDIILNIGDVYNSVISNQLNSNLMTESQYEQAKNESDNVYLAYSDLGKFLGTTDLSTLDYQMTGNARTYTGGTGSNVYESELACKFTASNTDYLFKVQLQKDSELSDVQAPSQSTILISNFEDSDFVQKTLNKVFDHLNVSSIKLENKLDISPESIKDNTLDSFAKLVNQVNSNDDNFVPISKDTASNFISTYKNYEISDKSSDLDVTNFTIVDDFLKEFKSVVPDENTVEDDNTNKNIEDKSRFPSIIYDSKKFRIYADFDLDKSNTRCVQVKCYILNKTNKDLTLGSEDFTLRTMQSSRYPANYQSLLREYDNDFDMKKAPESFKIGKNGYLETTMYFIVQNGIEYMDFWYREENLGVLISY